jgi:cell division protein FtsB
MKRIIERWLLPPVILALLTAGVYAAARLSLDPDAEQRNARLSDELSRVRSVNDQLGRDAAALRAELSRLRNRPDERLFHARTQLGLVRPGEVVYQLDPPHAAEPPASPNSGARGKPDHGDGP